MPFVLCTVRETCPAACSNRRKHDQQHGSGQADFPVGGLACFNESPGRISVGMSAGTSCPRPEAGQSGRRPGWLGAGACDSFRRVLKFLTWAAVGGWLLWGGLAGAAPLADLTPILAAQPDRFGRLLATPETYRLQVLVSEVITNPAGRPDLRRFGYRVDAEYFYPASSIKLGAAVTALHTIEELQAVHHSVDLLAVPLTIAPLFPGDPAQTNDPSNLEGGQITLAHELRKLALVSDNDAFNRLFDLVGHEHLNENLHALGLESVVINHRLSESRAVPGGQASASVTFFPPGEATIVVPERHSTLNLTNRAARLQVGRGFMRDGQLVHEPMDFTHGNGISLADLQSLLVKLVRPDIDQGTPPLQLTPAHRAWLLRAMTEYPRESTNPVYAATEYPDDYCKFLLPGIRRVFPATAPGERMQITAKIGQAYGFSIENSYVYNPANGRAVFVTAVIYTNAREILNTDQYEYDTVAAPFYADLGELVARRWLGPPAP